MKMICTLLISIFVLAACNTMQGVGEDIERGGQKIQGAAQDAE